MKNSYLQFMNESEFLEMHAILKEQQREVSSSVEAADALLTKYNLKHLLVPIGTNAANTPDVSR
ncbi:hypothetical protein SAMN05518672_1011159 [Chitinophaga sp. CF118]|uniref:hypothetical protein n=1 Tax=Chitinophaga sp. CF118 TaxID=1884367 RepID=UPI0008F0D347|nr:hypothetical protein [Chitinophaga sp. CF118]SFD23073.1 hypothetical protein SAMN05518672_1011159 [Chitinophaga sp. CF118]